MSNNAFFFSPEYSRKLVRITRDILGENVHIKKKRLKHISVYKQFCPKVDQFVIVALLEEDPLILNDDKL